TSSSFESVPIADATWNGRLPYDRTFNGGTTDVFVLKMTSGLTFSQTDGVTFSTLFGGNREEETTSMWLDADGRIYIGGNTTSTNMPTSGSVYSTPLGQQDGFVAQIADNGTQVLGCTYIGGSGNDIVRKVRPSNRTSAFLVSGSTSSSDFPTEGFGVTTERFGLTDGFVTMMNFASLTVSTLLTGLESDTVVDAVLDFRGDILIAANSTSTNLFKHDSAYAGYSGASDGYLTKFAPGSLEIVTPKGGEVYCVGASRPLAWDASGVTDTTKFRIEYSLEGSGKWSELVKSVGGRSYLWKIPANTPAGSYILRISTVNGHVSTLTTPFTIDVAPTITKQPTSTVVCQGARLSLSVTSSSVASKYQWRKDGVNIQGATSATLTVDTAAASSAGRYDCVITGECPPAITTQPATVTVTQRPAVTTQPVSQTVDEGKPLSLSVVATGVGLSYQWKRDGASINGATTPTLSVGNATKADEGSYVCEVAGSCGSVSTQAAIVKVNSGTSVLEVESVAGRMTVVGPQPAVDAVTIGLQLVRPQDLTARFFDAQGRVLTALSLGLINAGDHITTLSVAGFSEGVVMLEVSSETARWMLPVVIRR
ncbi:MAG: immunoglobulin domain-containing protein, partial [Bacteroidota bacterium]